MDFKYLENYCISVITIGPLHKASEFKSSEYFLFGQASELGTFIMQYLYKVSSVHGVEVIIATEHSPPKSKQS